MSTRRIRTPAVAGAFYPAPRRELERAVQRHLDAAREASARDAAGAVDETSAHAPKALIVPHAGYVYSGAVAARAYARLEGLGPRIERVVLLGPCHRVWVRGLAASGADAFSTPMGEVPLDREAIERACRLPFVECFDAAHSEEHSLEVQLPFLQRLLGNFRLVPFAVGEAGTAEVAELLDLLWGAAETLIVISSDLSHYHDYETARRLDTATSRAIEGLAADELDEESACGRIPVRGLLEAARRHGLRARTLDLRNSGDTAGSRDRVVGYGSYEIF